jgi:leukotriene-A4 hydrolase
LFADPDDAFSRIPYEKGHTFLFYLETVVGGAEVFEPYLKAHITRFAGKSICTKEWKDFLFEFYAGTKAEAALKAVDWDTWLFGTGMPPVIPEYDKSLLEVVERVSEKWLTDCPPKDDQLNFRDSLNPGQKSRAFPLMCIHIIS